MTVTEADRNRRKGFMPWWRRRSWSTDLDALTRLHKGLRTLDVAPDAQHKPVPAPSAANPPQTGRPSAAMPREAALHEEASGGQMLTGQTLVPESESAQTLPFEAGQEEQGPDQKDAVPG